MPLSREDRIYLAYNHIYGEYAKRGVKQAHARALVYVGAKFELSPLVVQRIANDRRSAKAKRKKK